MSPFSVTATTTEVSLMMFWSSSGLRMSRGSATEPPCWRNGVMTMKMIRSTSMMSTIGVTLMSDWRPPPPPAVIPIAFYSFGAPGQLAARLAARPARAGNSLPRAPGGPERRPSRNLKNLRPELPRAILQEVVDQLRRRVVHLNDEAVNLAREVVEEPHGGHGHGESERRRQQSLGDAARDRADAGRLRGLHAGEGVDDAEHRAEESDERGRRADGGEAGESALELGALDGDGSLQGAL